MFALQLFIGVGDMRRKKNREKENKIKAEWNGTLTIAWRQENKQLAYQRGAAVQIESENYAGLTHTPPPIDNLSRPCQTEGQSQITLATTSFGRRKKQFLIQNLFSHVAVCVIKKN